MTKTLYRTISFEDILQKVVEACRKADEYLLVRTKDMEIQFGADSIRIMPKEPQEEEQEPYHYQGNGDDGKHIHDKHGCCECNSEKHCCCECPEFQIRLQERRNDPRRYYLPFETILVEKKTEAVRLLQTPASDRDRVAKVVHWFDQFVETTALREKTRKLKLPPATTDVEQARLFAKLAGAPTVIETCQT